MRHPPVIFLDVDGVLNRSGHSGHGLEEEKLRLLKDIVDSTGAVVVVSSSWRKDVRSSSRLFTALAARGIPWAGQTPSLDAMGEGGLVQAASRGVEIKEWLAHNPQVKRYVILDDDPDADTGTERLILTRSGTGLTMQLAREATMLILMQR